MHKPASIANLEIRQEKTSGLDAYGEVPIAFTVYSIFEMVPSQNGLRGMSMLERQLDAPYIKDYDLEGSGRPAQWLNRFDTRNWVVFSAYAGAERLGGATLAWKTPDLTLVPYRHENAIIWDLRVRPDMRSRGVGSQLICAVKEWAKAKGCDEIFVETQNINVPACRFYAQQGFELFSINPLAYPELPNEIQLLWRFKIS